MGQSISLNTTRLHCIGAYLAQPTGTPRGGIVVVQEIFGVNAHIRAVADRFAEAGYTAIAPCFFDHVESGVELGYDEAGLAYELVAARADLQAIVDAWRHGRDAPAVRTLTGWRRELVGAELLDLLDGRLTLSVDGDRRLHIDVTP